MPAPNVFRCFEIVVYPEERRGVKCREGISFYERTFTPFIYTGNPHAGSLQQPTWGGHLRYTNEFRHPSEKLRGPVTNTEGTGGRLDFINWGDANGKFTAHNVDGSGVVSSRALIAIACQERLVKTLMESIATFPEDQAKIELSPDGHNYGHNGTTANGSICIVSFSSQGCYSVIMERSEFGQDPLQFRIVVSKNFEVSVDGQVDETAIRVWRDEEDRLREKKNVFDNSKPDPEAVFA